MKKHSPSLLYEIAVCAQPLHKNSANNQEKAGVRTTIQSNNPITEVPNSWTAGVTSEPRMATQAFWILTHQRHEWLGQIWRQRDRKALEHTGAKIHLTMSLSHTITAFEELSFFSLELKRRISLSVSRPSRYYKNTFSQRIVSHYFKSP